jgi:hypothetical protein
MLDSVDTSPLVEWIPETPARAKLEAGAGCRYFNPPLALHVINPDNPDQHVKWKVAVSCIL